MEITLTEFVADITLWYEKRYQHTGYSINIMFSFLKLMQQFHLRKGIFVCTPKPTTTLERVPALTSDLSATISITSDKENA